MLQANHIARSGTAGCDCLDGIFSACFGKVSKERITGAQWQEPKRHTLCDRFTREQTIHNFVAGAVSTHCEEAAESLSVAVTCDARGIARLARLNYLDSQTMTSQPLQRCGCQFAATTSARSGIDNCQVRFHVRLARQDALFQKH